MLACSELVFVLLILVDKSGSERRCLAESEGVIAEEILGDGSWFA